MKTLLLSVVFSMIGWTGIVPGTADKGFAVVELFTSEGCSSCPPADELLAHIQDRVGDRPVYVLAYHVDYWNRLGWKDQFSDAAYSKRQYQYNKWFTSQVYTPQLIVNGKTECLGSDKAAVESAIAGALGGSASALVLRGERAGEKVVVHYDLGGGGATAAKGQQLSIAVVEKRAVSKVEKGENAGRTLTHVQIVRRLYSFDIGSSVKGTSTVSVLREFKTGESEMIGFLQDTTTGEIRAAARVGIISETSNK